MTSLELVISHSVKVAIVVCLWYMTLRNRHRTCWTFTAYLVVILAGNSLGSFWPSRFLRHDVYVVLQGLYDFLKLLVAVEIAFRVFRVFPGARATARLVVLSLLIATTLAFMAVPRDVPYATWFEWQPRIVLSTVWLYAGTAMLVLWYRLPIRMWHRDILLGFTPYLLIFVTALGLLRKFGWGAVDWLGMLDSVAYLALVSWWAWAAARRPSAVDEPLGLEPHSVSNTRSNEASS